MPLKVWQGGCQHHSWQPWGAEVSPALLGPPNLAGLCISPVTGLPGAAADEGPQGDPGDTGQHPQRAVLPGSVAPQGIGFSVSLRSEGGGM